MTITSYLKNIWILYCKEFNRLKHNPAALMAVGLMVIMALLINIETKSIQKEKKANNQSSCIVAYHNNYPLIAHLKQNRHPKLNITFRRVDRPITVNSKISYPKNTYCAAELSFNNNRRNTLNIIFRSTNANSNKLHGFTRWLLSNTAAFYSDFNVQQKIAPFKLAKNKSKNKRTSFDLGNKNAKAMVSAMLLFSTQFFICCALFISLSASEKEKGVINALALTPVSTQQMLYAKYLFHLSISLIASLIVLSILQWNWIVRLWPILFFTPIFFFTSINLVSIASIIVSYNKTQTAASLMGFCYLMLVGVVFALSKQFIGFTIIKELMFESHSISLYNQLFNQLNQGMIPYIASFTLLAGITVVLFFIARYIWIKKIINIK